MASIRLKPDRDRSVRRRHPWIFSGAIAGIDGSPEPGDTVLIQAADGTPLGRGAYSPRSQIAARIWTFDPEEEVTSGFFRSRIERALRSRDPLPRGSRAARRLVNAESDGLPGLIVDLYGRFLVCQFLAAGSERWRQEIVEQLAELVPSEGIYERSDTAARNKEGLPQRVGVLRGAEPPELVEIQEGACVFLVDVKAGQKTGFYLDQRENRARLSGYAAGREMLNCFSYTGSFAVTALKAGAERALNVDSSSTVLELARRTAARNDLDATRFEVAAGNAFGLMRGLRDAGRLFDLVVLDPPRFVDSRRNLRRASRGYKDINLLGFRLLRANGYLFTFSCSGLMPPDLFQKIVADAALDAGREAQIVGRLSQASDHPTDLAFPEGDYLKGLICRVR